MHVPCMSDRYGNAAAEQMNASATELTKKMLVAEERLDYLERAQRREQMKYPAANKIPRFKLPESIQPRAEAEEVTSEIEIYRDEDRSNLFETAKKFRKSQIEVLKLEHKQLNKKNRQTFVKEWKVLRVKILNIFREEYDEEGGRLPLRVQSLDYCILETLI